MLLLTADYELTSESAIDEVILILGFGRSNPVAMTVSWMSSFMSASMTAPKMMLHSGGALPRMP